MTKQLKKLTKKQKIIAWCRKNKTLLVYISGVLSPIIVQYVYHKITYTAQVEIHASAFLNKDTVIDQEQHTYVSIPAQVINKGDAPYYMREAKLKVKVKNVWHSLHYFSMNFSKDYERGSNTIFVFDSLFNLSGMHFLDDHKDVTGRFVFITDNGSLRLNPNSSYEFCIVLTDTDGDEYEYSKTTTERKHMKPGFYDPNIGIMPINQ